MSNDLLLSRWNKRSERFINGWDIKLGKIISLMVGYAEAILVHKIVSKITNLLF